METQTTPEQIDAMKSVALQIQTNPLVESAWVDDWGRFGNFALKVIPKDTMDRHNTNRIGAMVRKTLPKGARIREIFGPEPVIERNSWTRTSRVRSYSHRSWNVDIDYMRYDPDRNVFG